MNGKLLPADTYIVVNKTILSIEDKKKITMLYQPIIGHTAVSLYLTLIDDLESSNVMSNQLTHHHLVTTMQLKLGDIIIAREKLEAVGLVKSYVRESNVNNYVYVLYSPLSVSDFLNHPILSVALYNNIGKKEYEMLVSNFKVPRINLKDYQDITANFSSVFTSVNRSLSLENDNIVKKNIGTINVDDKVDFDLLISSIPKNMVSEKCFNDDVRNLINSLAFTYNIDDLNMQGLVRDSINEKGLIDKNELSKLCRNFYEFDNAGRLPTLIYSKQPEYLKSPKGDTSNWAKQVYTFENVTPNDYLRSKYKNGEPSMRELAIIEDIMTKKKLKAGVVNVLISYVLKVNDNKFTKNYVEAVADQWAKENIETVEDAMKYAEKSHKKFMKQMEAKKGIKYNSAKTQIKEFPSWLEDESLSKLEKKEMTKDDQEEIDRLLKDFS